MASILSSIVSTSSFQPCRLNGVPYLPYRPRAAQFRLASSNKNTFGWEYNGRLVDEDMIVLRTRIHEMRADEKDWMVWEKQYDRYRSDVCEFVGMIQTFLLNSRPSVAIGTVVLVAMAMPTSAVLISLRLMEMAKWLMHLG